MTLPVDYFSEERAWEKQPLREPVRMPDAYNGRDSRYRKAYRLLRRVLRGLVCTWLWNDLKSELLAKLNCPERERLSDLVYEKVIIEGLRPARYGDPDHRVVREPDGTELRPHSFYVDREGVLCIYKPEQSPKHRSPQTTHEITMVLRESELYLKMADGFWYCFNLVKSDDPDLNFKNAGLGHRFKIESTYYDGKMFTLWPDMLMTDMKLKILSKRRVKGPAVEVSADRNKRREHSGFHKQEQRRSARREKVKQRNDPHPTEVYDGHQNYIGLW